MNDSTRRRKRVIAASVFVLAAILAWLLWPDRQLARAKELRKQLAGDEAKTLSQEERRERFRQLREATQKLTPAQRRELAVGDRQRRQDEMTRFAAMSKAEKKKVLDPIIDRMEAMRKQSAANSAVPNRPRGPGGPPGNRPPQTPEQRELRRKERLDSTTPEERAARDVFRKAMEARRIERGLPAIPPRR